MDKNELNLRTVLRSLTLFVHVKAATSQHILQVQNRSQ